MAHSSHSHEIPLRRLDPLPNGLRLAGPVLTIIGLLVFVAALLTEPARAWHSYLFNWIWAFGIAQGAVVLAAVTTRSEEHTSELQSRENLVCRLLLEKETSGL